MSTEPSFPGYVQPAPTTATSTGSPPMNNPLTQRAREAIEKSIRPIIVPTEHHGLNLDVTHEFVDRILAALASVLDEMEKDSRRLEWLDHNCPNYSVGRTMNAPENPDPTPFAFKFGLGSRVKTIPFRGSVRHAIDAAMSGTLKAIDPFPPLPEHMQNLPVIDCCEHGTPQGYYCAKCDAMATPSDSQAGKE